MHGSRRILGGGEEGGGRRKEEASALMFLLGEGRERSTDSRGEKKISWSLKSNCKFLDHSRSLYCIPEYGDYSPSKIGLYKNKKKFFI